MGAPAKRARGAAASARPAVRGRQTVAKHGALLPVTMEEAAAPAAKRRSKAVAVSEPSAATSDGGPKEEGQVTRMLRCGSAGAMASRNSATDEVGATKDAAAPAIPTWQRSPAKRTHMTSGDLGKENVVEAAACAEPQHSGPADCGFAGNPDGPASLAALLPPGDSLLRRLLLGTCPSN